MSGVGHTFSFSLPGGKPPSTARKIHIKRLYDIVQLSMQRGDLARARRAFAILAQCKEVAWKDLWKTGLSLLGDSPTATDHKRLDFLRTMLLQHPDERLAILQELILLLITSGRDREALDELELYLPSLPYSDNPVLHTYAGLICLHLAQPEPDSSEAPKQFDAARLRDAQGHLERAQLLDPTATVPQVFLAKISDLHARKDQTTADYESDEEGMAVDRTGQPRKKART
ncbi:hypothetical protein FA95DRAFT_1555881 [Auriscalpium vulgare]|uniref:Uncharacterized protein n=1 Tax=Auriscalpium vulgare TaxID=40419 RepID=A0ACB8S2A5_9AGAM|nr:hypothetical protein FA95DRAFT_1555881 [Auriscalpium vulgare]